MFMFRWSCICLCFDEYVFVYVSMNMYICLCLDGHVQLFMFGWLESRDMMERVVVRVIWILR